MPSSNISVIRHSVFAYEKGSGCRSIGFGNITYGYLGKAMGFSDEVVFWGGGAAHTASKLEKEEKEKREQNGNEKEITKLQKVTCCKGR